MILPDNFIIVWIRCCYDCNRILYEFDTVSYDFDKIFYDFGWSACDFDKFDMIFCGRRHVALPNTTPRGSTQPPGFNKILTVQINMTPNLHKFMTPNVRTYMTPNVRICMTPNVRP